MIAFKIFLFFFTLLNPLTRFIVGTTLEIKLIISIIAPTICTFTTYYYIALFLLWGVDIICYIFREE